MKKILAILILISGALSFVPVQASALCAVALWKGSVLDYEFVSGLEHVFLLQQKAEKLLAEKGYDNYDRGLDIRHMRGQTALDHGYAIIIEARYIPPLRKVQQERRSIGCGFSNRSYDDALWDALRNLQTHDWSYVPDRDGYKVIGKIRF